MFRDPIFGVFCCASPDLILIGVAAACNICYRLSSLCFKTFLSFDSTGGDMVFDVSLGQFLLSFLKPRPLHNPPEKFIHTYSHKSLSKAS